MTVAEADRQAAAIHEAGHACACVISGMDLEEVIVVRQATRDGIGGYCAVADRDAERDADGRRWLTYLAAGASSERKAGYSLVRDTGDRAQSQILAEALYGPGRATTFLASAKIEADALMDNPDVWRWVERTARALVRRGRLSHRDVFELGPHGQGRR
jgi:hypothetical protein